MIKNLLIIKGLDIDKFFKNHSETEWLVLDIKEFVKNYRGLKRNKYQEICIGYSDIKDKILRYFIEIFLIFISSKKKYFIDNRGNIEKFSFWRFILIHTPLFIGEIIFDLLLIIYSWFILLIFSLIPQRIKKVSDNKKEIIYLRTDNFRNLQEGGSFTHFRGIVKGFYQLGFSVYYIGSGDIEVPQLEFPKTIIPYPLKFNFPEIPEIYYNWRFIPRALRIIQKEKPLFIYQRHSIF